MRDDDIAELVKDDPAVNQTDVIAYLIRVVHKAKHTKLDWDDDEQIRRVLVAAHARFGDMDSAPLPREYWFLVHQIIHPEREMAPVAYRDDLAHGSHAWAMAWLLEIYDPE